MIQGANNPDFADPAGEAHWIGAQLGSTPLLVDGAGHYPHAERPDEVGAAIAGFLREKSVIVDREKGTKQETRRDGEGGENGK